MSIPQCDIELEVPFIRKIKISLFFLRMK